MAASSTPTAAKRDMGLFLGPRSSIERGSVPRTAAEGKVRLGKWQVAGGKWQ